MRLTFRITIFCVGFLLLFQSSFVFAESKVKVKVGEKMPNFKLEGTDDKEHELEKMKGKVVVLIMGTRKLDKENDRWLHALGAAFKEKIEKENSEIKVFVVADMRGIPRFLPKSTVRRLAKKFMKDEKLPFTKIALFDWKQKINKLLGADKDKVDIFVVDKKGILAHHQVVPYSEENFSVLKSKIEGHLTSGDNNNGLSAEGDVNEGEKNKRH